MLNFSYAASSFLRLLKASIFCIFSARMSILTYLERMGVAGMLVAIADLIFGCWNIIFALVEPWVAKNKNKLVVYYSKMRIIVTTM